MRIKLIFLFAGLLAIPAIQGCYDTFNCEPGRGQIITEEIHVEPFTGIQFEEAGNVFISQDTTQSVFVESYENIIAGLGTSVRDGMWHIRFRGCFKRYDKFNVYITVPDLNSVILSGSGNIVGEGPFEVEALNVFISGSGNIDLEAFCESVDADISGSGNITLSGQTDTEAAFISGSGNIFASEMESASCEVNISGSGNCDVFVTDQLNVVISGSGSVRYRGNPNTVNSTITGSGAIIPIN